MTGWAILRDNIPQRYLADLEAKAPSLPISMFRFAVSRYMEGVEGDKPATIRDELDTLADVSIRLAAVLDELSITASDILAVREARHRCEGLSKRLANDLQSLVAVAEMARRDVEQNVTSGRRISPNTRLVSDLTQGLRIAGVTVDARPNGELVQAFGIALSVAGRDVADPVATVKSALRTMAKQ